MGALPSYTSTLVASGFTGHGFGFAQLVGEEVAKIAIEEVRSYRDLWVRIAYKPFICAFFIRFFLQHDERSYIFYSYICVELFWRMNNMFSLFSLVFVLGTSNVSANELDVDCESPLNQSEILYCVTRSYERSEEMMVNLYKSISSKSDKLGKQYLMEVKYVNPFEN